jgi:hypothetical protein
LSRFAFFTGSVMFVALVLLCALMFEMPDHFNPTDPPYTLCENVLRYSSTVFLWPFAATALAFGGELTQLWCFLLWVATGLFWGFILELICIKRPFVRSNIN